MTAARQPRYADRTVVITGSRKGLGHMLAEYFLEQGAQVIGISRGSATIVHPRYDHASLDVGDDRAVRRAFLEVGRSHRSVDIVINNAAVAVARYALLTAASDAEELVRTNLLGGLYVSREAAKLMRKSGGGRIINIGSMHSVLEPVGASVYAATKTALMTLAAVLAKEFAGYGITVNTLGVTALQTDMLDQISQEFVDGLVASLPIPRLATPEDIFNVVDFFASPASGYITAQSVFLGGIHR